MGKHWSPWKSVDENYIKMHDHEDDKITNTIFQFYFSGESEFLKSHGQKNLDANLNRQHMNPTSNGRPYFASIGKTYRIRNGYTVTLECSIENIGKVLLTKILKKLKENLHSISNFCLRI